jgi:hypothetical protein
MVRAIAGTSRDWIRIMNGQLQAFATDRFEFPLPADHLDIDSREAAIDQQLQLAHL